MHDCIVKAVAFKKVKLLGQLLLLLFWFFYWFVFFSFWTVAKWLLICFRLCYSHCFLPFYRFEIFQYFTDWVIPKHHSSTIVLFCLRKLWNKLYRAACFFSITTMIHLVSIRGCLPLLFLLLLSSHLLLNKHNLCLALQFHGRSAYLFFAFTYEPHILIAICEYIIMHFFLFLAIL
jgi:hypothetical protein